MTLTLISETQKKKRETNTDPSIRLLDSNN